jgi:plasmid stabilization system protein ParE
MSGDTPKYELFVNDEAEQNLEAAYFYVSSLTTSERALEWVADLRSALEKLARFPGLDEYETIQETAGREARRLLYSLTFVEYPREIRISQGLLHSGQSGESIA